MKTRRLHTCNSEPEAHLIKARLNNEGIECILNNGNFTTLMPMYNTMLGGGVQILVSDSDLEAAREILKNEIGPSAWELICPKCKSNEIGFGLGENRITKIFFIFIAILSALPFGNFKAQYYCKKCNSII